MDLSSLPLCVDMDGTLIRTDSLWEACLQLIITRPYRLLQMIFWLLRGKAGFKQQVSKHIELSPQVLPYTEELLEYLKLQKQAGRTLLLVTAADQKLAQSIADYLGLFDEVMASDGKHNLSGKHKATALVARYGKAGFVYAANAAVDLQIWSKAAAAIVVNAPKALHEKVKRHYIIEKVFGCETAPRIRTFFKAMRIHQWSKNMLVFAPFFLAHAWDTPDKFLIALLAFFAFGFTASSVYLINDLVDLEDDRTHPEKQHRPFANGTLSIQWGIILIPLLLLAAFAIASQVNASFIAVLVIYLILTSAYSFYLKQLMLIDVLSLTSLYTLRIIAGAFSIVVPLSYWLLAFSMFIFLSLALSKRYTELLNLKQQLSEKQQARGYHVHDLPMVSLFGLTSGYLSVLVLILYIHDLQADILYSQPTWLWIVAMAILYWISRIWVLAHRGVLNEDPVLFAIHDRTSYIVSLVIISSMLLAL